MTKNRVLGYTSSLQTYCALFRGVGSLFSHVGQQSKSGRIESDRGVNSATQSAIRDLGCFKLHQRGLGRSPSRKRFFGNIYLNGARSHQLFTMSERLHKMLNKLMMYF